MNLFAAVHAKTLGAPLVATPAEASHAVPDPAALAALLDGDAPAGLTVVVAGDRLARGLHDRAVAAGRRCTTTTAPPSCRSSRGARTPTTSGRSPGVDVVVRDGEVWVRSPYLCLGYDGPPGPLRRDPDGFADRR